jgi:hypothetical protein
MSFKTFVAHGFLHSAASAIEPATRAVAQVANTALPNEIPSAEVVMDLALRGWIDEATLATYCSMNGVALDPGGVLSGLQKASVTQNTLELWNRVWLAKQELPTVQEFLTIANRMRITDTELDVALKRLGYYNDRVRADVENLRYEIPSSSDLVRFSVKHVFEPDLIRKLGYNDEFRPILDLWHRFQGLNYPIFSGPFAGAVATFEESRGLSPGSFVEQYAAAGLEDPTWAQAFWWSHWVLPSPTQGYQMYFRFRPDRDRRFDAPGTSAINFSGEDLNLLLRANDYPPYYRAALAGIAHRVPGLRFLRQLRSTDVFDKGMVKELLLRQGYADGDATVLAEAVERQDRDQRRKTIEQQAKGQLAKYWELGVIDQQSYQDLLVKHGLSAQDAKTTADLANLDLQYKRLSKIIEFVRRQFLLGAITEPQAIGQLQQAGVVLDRIGLYIEDWKLELTTKHKTLSAGKAVQLACKGLLTLADLNVRLGNLGYQGADRFALVQEATLCQQGLAARAAASEARAQRQLQSDLKRQQRDAAQAIVAARRQLAAHGTPAQLRKWFCEGHLGELEVYSRLRFLGWPDADITRMIGDCKSATSKPRPPATGP